MKNSNDPMFRRALGPLAPWAERLPRVFRIPLDAFLRFDEGDGWAIASHIALSTLMSLFPFLIVVTALAGLFGSKGLADEVGHILLDAWPAEVATPIANDLQRVATRTQGGTLTLGIVLATYFASSGIESLRIGLNRSYGVSETRSWWRLRLESVFYVIGSAIALLALSVLVVFGPLIVAAATRYLAWLEQFALIVTVARFAIAALVLAISLFIVHYWLPAGSRRFAEIVPGVVVTSRVVARRRRRLRALPRGFRGSLLADLRRAFLCDDRTGLSVFFRGNIHFWRRTQRRDRARRAKFIKFGRCIEPRSAISAMARDKSVLRPITLSRWVDMARYAQASDAPSDGMAAPLERWRRRPRTESAPRGLAIDVAADRRGATLGCELRIAYPWLAATRALCSRRRPLCHRHDAKA